MGTIPCGSMHLDIGFEELLRARMGDFFADSVRTTNTLRGARRHFETMIKSQYNGYDEDNEEEYEIPLPGWPDQPEIALEDGFLKLSRLKILLNIINIGMIYKPFLTRFLHKLCRL
jgi:hypothetical protein